MYGEPGKPTDYTGYQDNYNQYNSVPPTTGVPVAGGGGSYYGSGMPPPPPPPPGASNNWGDNMNMNNGFPNQAQPGVTCTMTSTTLDNHLRESGHGSNQAIFGCYFMPNMMPPRCIACQRLIAEHPSGSGTNVAGGFNSSRAGDVTLSIGGGGESRPSITSKGSIDTYENSGLMIFRWIGSIMLLVAAILAIVFGATLDTNEPMAGMKFMAPGILGFMGIIFTLITKKITLTFNKESREVKYHCSKFPWVCLNTSHSFNFGDVQGVEVRETNVSINHVPQSSIYLKVRTGSDVDLGMHGMWSANSHANGWRNYLREIGCSFQ